MTPKPIAGYPSHTAAIMALRAEGLTARQVADKLELYPSDVSAIIATKRRRDGGTERQPRSSDRSNRTVQIPADVLDAFTLHAERRGISVNQLVRALLGVIADDRMVDSVLDDLDDPAPQHQQVPA